MVTVPTAVPRPLELTVSWPVVRESVNFIEDGFLPPNLYIDRNSVHKNSGTYPISHEEGCTHKGVLVVCVEGGQLLAYTSLSAFSRLYFQA